MTSLFNFIYSRKALANAQPVPTRQDLTKKQQLKLRRELQQRQTADFYYLIDVVGRCNLRCPSCPVGNYAGNTPKGTMSLETYRAILEKIALEHPGEKIFIDLYNWGEPGLHKELGEIVRMTKEKGYGVGISTNLNAFLDMGKVVRESPSYIRISLSGYYNENYKQTHRHGDINLVKANMHLLRQKIDHYRSDTIVQVGFHVYRTNFQEDFWKMKTLCEDLEFIFAPTLAAYMPGEKALKLVEGNPMDEDREILEKLVVPMETRVKLLSSYRDQYRDCQYRKVRTTINYDGSVPICCVTFEDEQIIAKNFLEHSRAEIQKRKYTHSFCKKCQKCSLDMLYTNVEPHHVEDFAVSVLGPEYKKFLDEWNVSLDPVVEWEGRDLSAQEAFDLAVKYETSADGAHAKQLYGEIVAAFPRHGEAVFRLGQIVEREGDIALALKYFQAAHAVWPTHQPYKDAVDRLCATSNV